MACAIPQGGHNKAEDYVKGLPERISIATVKELCKLVTVFQS